MEVWDGIEFRGQRLFFGESAGRGIKRLLLGYGFWNNDKIISRDEVLGRLSEVFEIRDVNNIIEDLERQGIPLPKERVLRAYPIDHDPDSKQPTIYRAYVDKL